MRIECTNVLDKAEIYYVERFGYTGSKFTLFLLCLWLLLYIYVIMKTICPPGYQNNGFVGTHALGHMMCG